MDNLFFIFLISVFIVVIVPLLVAGYIYTKNFGRTFEKIAVDSKLLDEYSGLKLDKRSFKSNKDQALAGFLYSGEYDKPKGIVVLAHGYGTGGHTYYLDVINYFAKNGYKVFTYDATGNGDSQVMNVGGFPQGILDLKSAIKYVKSNDELKNLPLMLWGHSWGGYSVGSVLVDYPNVTSAISVSGVNSSKLVLEDEGRNLYGSLVELILPYIVGFERLKFGKYSSYNALDGFKSSNIPVMVIHSTDDQRVPMEMGYDLYFNKFKDEARFEFVKLHNRDHNNPYYTEDAVKYRSEADLSYAKYLKEKGIKDDNMVKEKYFNNHFIKEKLFELDTELMDKMVDFYDRSIENILSEEAKGE